MTIKNITELGRLNGVSGRFIATINVTEYIDHSLTGVNWLHIDIDMVPQTYQLLIRDIYTVRFSFQTSNEIELVSVEK